jgi:hypothetical protein
MAVHIKQLDNGNYYVNDKLLIKDMNGYWIAQTDLTVAEAGAFQKHIKKVSK